MPMKQMENPGPISDALSTPQNCSRLRMLGRWFSSRAVRQATDLNRQVRRLVNEQRDLLSSEALEELAEKQRALKEALRRNMDKSMIDARAGELLKVAESRLIAHPHPSARENVKELFVAAALVMSVTCFFVQLTKIPTGSMQPTLFGVTSEDWRQNPDAQIPGRLQRIVDFWWRGISYYQLTAKADGEVTRIDPPRLVFPFVKTQRIQVGPESYRIWLPPDELKTHTGLSLHQFFRAGEDIFKAKVVTGDHLLVDRFTYNFRRPARGEIIVFKTKGIEGLDQGQLYIKRLVALGGEQVRLGNDRHLVINGKRLDATTPRFENVYTFSGPPQVNRYSGHVNNVVANQSFRMYSRLAQKFPDENRVFHVPTGHYLAMGDNTMSSSDSRDWGALPQKNVIGKCWFVYWPITDRFGWGYR